MKGDDPTDKLTATHVGISRCKFLIGSAVDVGLLSSLGHAQTKNPKLFKRRTP